MKKNIFGLAVCCLVLGFIFGIVYQKRQQIEPNIEPNKELIQRFDMWHETWQDTTLNCRVGQLGVAQFLIDQHGYPLTSGYHGFFRKDGVIYGQAGTITEIVVYADGTINHAQNAGCNFFELASHLSQ